MHHQEGGGLRCSELKLEHVETISDSFVVRFVWFFFQIEEQLLAESLDEQKDVEA